MRPWIASFSVVLFFALSVLFLGLTGRSSRVYHASSGVQVGAPAALVKTSGELYSIWKNRGVRGRIVVHVGRYLHFVEPEADGLYGAQEGFPVEIIGLPALYESRLGNENFLLVSMNAGVAREVINVLPPDVFNDKRKAAAGQKGVSVSDDEIVTHQWGSKRTLTSGIPDTDEPVLLNIDASAFSHTEPGALMNALAESGLSTDMITLSLAEDNPDVTDSERDMMMEFHRLVEGR